MTTLRQAIIDQVNEFTDNYQSFSIYDITQAIRTKCNYHNLDIPECFGGDYLHTPGGFAYKYEIDHYTVRYLFHELNGLEFVLSADHSPAGYIVYTKYVNSTTTSTPVVTQPTNTVNSSDIKSRIQQYLMNKSYSSVPVSFKKIQSAIKRGRRAPGVTVRDIRDMVSKLGYSIYDTNEPISKQVVR